MTGRSIGLASASTLVAAFLVPVNLGAQTFDRSDAVGREVRVVATDGSRATGRLVALSDTEVVIRRDGTEQRFALTKVERVERVRHTTRNAALWAAAVVGGTAAAFIPFHENDGARDVAGVIVSWAGTAGAAGAGIGAAIGRANRDDNILYLSSRAPSIALAPAVSASGAGIGLWIEW